MSTVDRSRLPVPGPDPAFRFPAFEQHRLRGGLRVWTVEQRALPVVSFLVLVPSGAAADPAGLEGLAALTADLLDEGSDGRSAIEVQETLARIGSELDTEVGPDATLVLLTTLSKHAERALDVLSGVVTRPALAEADFSRVRELRLNRLLQLRDSPAAVADHVFLRELFRGHPYGHLSIGTAPGLRAAAPADPVAFHRDRYGPADTVVIAVGDGRHDRLARMVENAFGGWLSRRAGGEPGAQAGTSVPGPGTRPSRRLTVVDRPGGQSEIRIGHVAVERTHPDYHALLVLNVALGGQFVSRVNMNLRQDKGFTYGARTSFDFRREPGPFALQAAVHLASTTDAIRESLKEIDEIRGARPVSESELVTARAALTKGYPRNFETAEQVARALAQIALYGLPDDSLERFVPAIESVTASRVTEVARRHLRPDDLLVTIVGEMAAIGPGLGELGLGQPAVVPGLD